MITNLIELPELLYFHLSSFRKANDVKVTVRKYHQRLKENQIT